MQIRLTNGKGEIMRDREARIAHEKLIEKLEGELAPILAGKEREAQAEQTLDAEIGKLSVKAAGGDRDALKKQRELTDRKSETRLQQENLEKLASPIRKQIAEAKSELPNLVLSEAREEIIEQILALPAIVEKLSESIRPVARVFADFGNRVNAIAEQAMPLLGDDERSLNLSTRLRTAVSRGLIAQLASDFKVAGLHLNMLPKGSPTSFQGTVEPILQWLISALEIPLNANRQTAER